MRHLLGAIALVWASVASASPSALPPSLTRTEAESLSDAQRAWNDLQTAPSSESGTLTQKKWEELASKARQFRAKYPDSPNAPASRKLEITARLKAKGDQADTGLNAEIDTYLKDIQIPAADRFDIALLAKAPAFRRGAGENASNRLIAREQHARELLAQFPDEPRSYGYLLLVARESKGPDRARLAREVLNSPASEKIKENARRTIGQEGLVGKRLMLSGVDVSKYRGSPLLIYTWSSGRPDILKAVRFWSQVKGVSLLGINLDSDPAEAKALAASLQPPGDQFYAGGGLEGPAARRLNAVSISSVYLVNREGVLIDVDGHVSTLEKIKRLLATEESK